MSIYQASSIVILLITFCTFQYEPFWSIDRHAHMAVFAISRRQQNYN